ncbi:MAG: PadR family transcriptional regulator [Planctomycetota bacterium]|jgi:DNA-binding PadR family transcriptional regulator
MAILGLLSERPLHGYELRSAYQEHLVPHAELNIGQVYTTLDRLERDGLVAHERVSQTERPDKKVYGLTEQGREEFQRWLSTPAPIGLDLRNEAFLKVGLSRKLGGVDAAGVVATERRAVFERLAEVSHAKAQAERDGEPLAKVMLLELAELRLEAFLNWLERCVERIGEEGKQ